MSVYNNWYIAKAKKFEARAKTSEKGTILLEIETYDGLKIDATKEQWRAIIQAVEPLLLGKTSGTAPAPSRPKDDDVEY